MEKLINKILPVNKSYSPVGPFHAVLLTFLLGMLLSVAADVKTSDACHGNYSPQSTNVLSCDGHLTICPFEVRFYQWHTDDGCHFVISGHVDPRCCQHNDTRCYRTLDKADTEEIQQECVDKRVEKYCQLPAGVHQDVGSICSIAIGGVTVSSVRSIRYTCELGACPEYQRTTPVDDGGDITAAAVVGLGAGGVVGVTLGSLVLICAVIAVVLFGICKFRCCLKDAATEHDKIATDKGMDTKTNPIFDDKACQNEYDDPVFQNAKASGNEPEYVTIIADDSGLGGALCDKAPSVLFIKAPSTAPHNKIKTLFSKAPAALRNKVPAAPRNKATTTLFNKAPAALFIKAPAASRNTAPLGVCNKAPVPLPRTGYALPTNKMYTHLTRYNDDSESNDNYYEDVSN